jgi:hypothetical protein
VAIRAVAGRELTGLSRVHTTFGLAWATEAQHTACDCQILFPVILFTHAKVCHAFLAAGKPGTARN